MITNEEEKQVIVRKIEKLKKRINSLNESISLQANKIADTMTPMVISRDETILYDRIRKKKEAIEELVALKRELQVSPYQQSSSSK